MRFWLRGAAGLAACVALSHAVAWGRAQYPGPFASLPPSGEGFTTYSTLLGALGRQYVRAEFRLALEEAFADRHRARPDRVFVVGETGRRGGGELWPHASHRDGFSADIFLPTSRGGEELSTLSHQPWNLWGYCHHFDVSGHYAGQRWEAAPLNIRGLFRVSPCLGAATRTSSDGLRIDFEETASLLLSMAKATRAHGLRIKTIVLAPEFVPLLLKTREGGTFGDLAQRITRRPAWIRHDEHVHIECEPNP